MTSRAAESIVVFLNLNGVSCPPCDCPENLRRLHSRIGSGRRNRRLRSVEAGADVVLMEAGDVWYASRDSKMMFPNYFSAPRRRAASAVRRVRRVRRRLEIDGEPYTTAPGTRFLWWRARMLGGRTNHWGRISLRFGPDDFRRKTLDGMGDDWPISYDDVALITTASTRSSASMEAAREFHTSPMACFNRRRLHAMSNADQEGKRQPRHHLHSRAQIGYHEAAEWKARVSLLRPMWPWVHIALEFLQP